MPFQFIFSLVVLNLFNFSFGSKIYSIQSHLAAKNSLYGWEEVSVSIDHPMNHSNLIRKYDLLNTSNNQLNIIDIPIYVSLTTISSRIEKLNNTILSLLKGKLIPTTIFIFISKDPYLLDKGIEEIPDELLALTFSNKVKIVYTENIGPHRKLLPLLYDKWEEDCIIINVDDDLGLQRHSDLIYQLINSYYSQFEDSVVSLRARRIGLCLGEMSKTSRYHSWLMASSLRNEMLLMPTGTGGILYRPYFFHPIVFSDAFRLITGTADDLMFRLATMIRKVKVKVGCALINNRGKIEKYCGRDYLDQIKQENQTLVLSSNPRSNLNKDLYKNDTLSKDQNILYQNYSNFKNKDLYSINGKGLNDKSWNAAMNFLNEKGLLNFSSLISPYYFEREKNCYKLDVSKMKCAIWKCGK